MAVIYAAALRTARMEAVVDAIGESGKVEIRAGTTVLATIPLGNPAGTVSGDVLTFDLPQSDPEADASGAADNAVIYDSSGDPLITGLTVTAADGGGDIEMQQVTTDIVEGQQVVFNSFTITHASS